MTSFKMTDEILQDLTVLWELSESIKSTLVTLMITDCFKTTNLSQLNSKSLNCFVLEYMCHLWTGSSLMRMVVSSHSDLVTIFNHHICVYACVCVCVCVCVRARPCGCGCGCGCVLVCSTSQLVRRHGTWNSLAVCACGRVWYRVVFNKVSSSGIISSSYHNSLEH